MIMLPDDVQYAGFWVRVAASLIDSALVLIVLVPLLVTLYGWAYFDPARTGMFAGPADFLLSWVAPAMAVVAFWVYRQATPGKEVLSLKIVDAVSGEPPSTGQCIGRYLGYYVSMLPLFLGILWVAFDKRKQGWHDKLAGTVVIRVKKK
jgi:uncharacterized RDD family membrane protein YckC